MPLNTRTLLITICKYVYYAGAGNCWYEDIYHETIPYYMYSVVTFSIYTTMIFLENLAALFGNFPGVEKNSAVMFAAIHNIVLTKMFLLLYHKKSIRKLNYEMANVGAGYEEDYVMRKQYRKVTVGIWLYVISVYLSLSAYGIESARRSIVEGLFLYIFSHYLKECSKKIPLAFLLFKFIQCFMLSFLAMHTYILVPALNHIYYYYATNLKSRSCYHPGNQINDNRKLFTLSVRFQGPLFIPWSHIYQFTMTTPL